MTSSLLAAPRVTPNPWHALGGIWRLAARRFFARNYWLSVIGLLALLALLVYSMVYSAHPMGHARQFFGFVTLFYLAIILPITTFVSAAGAIRDDLKPGSVDYVFTRPLRRPAFVVFKYLAQMACLQIDFLLSFVVLTVVGVYRDVPGLGETLPMLLAAQFLLVLVFSAFGLFCGILTSRYVIIGLIYGAVVEVGLGQIPTQLNKVALIKQVLGTVNPYLDQAVSGLALTTMNPAPTPFATLVLLLGFVAAMLVLAALVFSRQELAGSQSAQS